MVKGIVILPSTVAQFIPAFVVICCSIGSADWILIGGAVLETHTACNMSTECLTDSKRWAFNIEARIEVWKENRHEPLIAAVRFHLNSHDLVKSAFFSPRCKSVRTGARPKLSNPVVYKLARLFVNVVFFGYPA